MALYKEYPWERFWCPIDGKFSFDEQGFLVDPDSEWGKYVDQNAVKFSDIAEFKCLILLGEPGIGKTKALNDAFKISESSTTSNLLLVDLRSYTSDERLVRELEKDSDIQSWIAGNYQLTLFVDSLDECLLNVKTVSTVLIGLINQWPHERLSIRFSCRTVDWPKILDDELKVIFNIENIPKYELLPLRKKDVVTAAQLEDINPEEFLKAVRDFEVSSFANRPITLRFLLDAFKNHGHFPSRKSELYWQGCIQLCEEQNQSRLSSGNKGKLTSVQRMIIAARIAAVVMFSKKYSIWTGVDNGNISDSDVIVRALSGFFETIDGIKIIVDEEIIRETLGRGLFNSRGFQQMGFSHQSYAEYLAAYYLSKHEMPIATIMNFIKHPDGKIIPQLQEVAVWLAAFDPSIFEEILKSQPELLLRVEKDAVNDDQKKNIITRMLKQYNSDLGTDVFKSINYFKYLNYKGISKQLKPFIKNQKNGVDARLTAILIARECELKDVLSILLEVALNQKEEFDIRQYAAFTIVSIGHDDVKASLMPFALGQAGNDPKDELKGIGLRAVWPNSISIDDLLNNITPLKNENLIGTYYHFLSHDFALGLRVEHLPIVINWITTKMPTLGDEILVDNFISGIMLKGWEYFENPLITEPFAKLAYRRFGTHQEYRRRMDDRTYFKELKEQPEKRRLLIEKILSLVNIHNDSYWLFYRPPLIEYGDIDWAIERIENETILERRKTWFEILFYLLDKRKQDDLEKAYVMYERFTEAREVFSPLFAPIELDSDQAKLLRDNEAIRLNFENKMQNTLYEQIDYSGKLFDYINKFNKGDSEAWWKLNLVFLDSGSTQGMNEFTPDLTLLPLWEEIDQETKNQLLLIGEQYLALRDGEAIWSNQNHYSRPALAAFRAFYLLAKIVPERLENFSSDIWRKWTDVLLSFPRGNGKYDKKTDQELINKLFDLDSENLFPILDEEIAREDAYGHLQILELIKKTKNKNLENHFVLLLENYLFSSPSSFEQILRFLLERNNSEAKQIAIKSLDSKQLIKNMDKGLSAARALISYSSDAGWPDIGNVIKQQAPFGEKLFVSLSFHENISAKTLIFKISEESVEDLFYWLENTFPEKLDPKLDGLHEVSDRERVGQFRNRLIVELANKGNSQACDALIRIAKKYPEKKWLYDYINLCQENTRRNTWKPVEPYEVIRLALNSYSEYLKKRTQAQRLIRNIVYVAIGLLLTVMPNLLDYQNNDILKWLHEQQIVVGVIFLILFLAQLFLENKKSD